jgi:hypothetical protein
MNKSDFVVQELQETSDRSWLFKVDGFHLDAPAQAKSSVAQATDARYRDLRARMVNPKGLGDKYVCVVEVLG